jgi:hypothetical protein
VARERRAGARRVTGECRPSPAAARGSCQNNYTGNTGGPRSLSSCSARPAFAAQPRATLCAAMAAHLQLPPLGPNPSPLTLHACQLLAAHGYSSAANNRPRLTVNTTLSGHTLHPPALALLHAGALHHRKNARCLLGMMGVRMGCIFSALGGAAAAAARRVSFSSLSHASTTCSSFLPWPSSPNCSRVPQRCGERGGGAAGVERACGAWCVMSWVTCLN